MKYSSTILKFILHLELFNASCKLLCTQYLTLFLVEYTLLRRVLYKLTDSDNVHVINQDFKETKRYDILIFY